MGQLALGFRSLLIKGAVFFVMAALLAWALGGTLWPRAEIVDLEPVSFGGREWFWRLAVGGSEPGAVRWTLMGREAGGDAQPVDKRQWAEVAGPVVTEEALYYAGRVSLNPGESWHLEQLDNIGTPRGSEDGAVSLMLPDRLAVERQLARVRAGMTLQAASEIRRQRGAVLEPPTHESP